MKRTNGIELFKFSIEKVLKKYGKCFLEMCGNPAWQTKVSLAKSSRAAKGLTVGDFSP